MAYDPEKLYNTEGRANVAALRYNEYSTDGTRYECQKDGPDKWRVVPVMTRESVKEPPYDKPTNTAAVERPKRGNRSWKPGGTLEIPNEYRHPDYTYSARNLDKPGRLGKLTSEGWEIDKELSRKGFNPGGADSGKSLDGRTMIGNLTIMRMHKEDAAARKEYFQARTKEQLEGSVNSIHSEGKVETYGEGLKISN